MNEKGKSIWGVISDILLIIIIIIAIIITVMTFTSKIDDGASAMFSDIRRLPYSLIQWIPANRRASEPAI